VNELCLQGLERKHQSTEKSRNTKLQLVKLMQMSLILLTDKYLLSYSLPASPFESCLAAALI